VRQPSLEDRAEYAVLLPILFLLRLLPPRAGVGAAGFLGRMAFDLLGFRREVTLENIRERLTPPEDAPADVPDAADVGRRCYAPFAMSLAEFARLPSITPDYVRRNIEIEGTAYLDAALDGGRGAVLVTGHFGSWELMGCALVMMGYPITFAVGVQRNPLVQSLMNRLRRDAGIELVEASRVLALARTLKSNKFVAMLSDQDAGRDGIFVDFMGKAASTPQGPARLALLAGSPVITGFITRLGGLRHRIEIEPPIWRGGPLGREAAIARITGDYTRAIEARVRERPDHWLWGHRRWKTGPA
jgi:KDO2-lipid IV(A) lauroyltransferase